MVLQNSITAREWRQSVLFRRNPAISRAKLRKTKTQRKNRSVVIFATLLVVGFLSVLAFRTFADIIEGNDVRVDVDSELTYYLSIEEDGVDAYGVESSDAQMANVFGGRVSVTDQIPNGLEFQGFVTTSDGTFGAVSRSDGSVQCSGKVVDDTNEAAVDTGTWNNSHTEYYYHGLHYDAATRTVSFTAEKIKAGCELTVGIIARTPATVDDPNTTTVETRRDFYNTAFAAEKDVTAISNTVHVWIGSSSTRVYKVRYAYTGSVPAGAPAIPTEQSYAENSEVAVSADPTLEGYTFSGWTTTDATVTNGSFEMPGQDVQLVGVWTKNAAATKYTVAYVINGSKPADFMPPATKEYEAGVSVPLDSTETNAVIDGYRFSGWSTQDATLSETGFIMPAQNVTISGSFVRISYTVCYEFEGAIMPPNADSLLPACETHYPGDTVTTANNPTASGYEFLGWYKNATFTMPETNVVIQGEWARALGKFTPTITKVIVNPKDEYMYGETVKFKITVTNTAAFEITDVYLEGKLPGAVFTESPDDSYIIRTSTVTVIPSIPAGASVDVYAEYKVTENIAQTLTNIVELTGALADGYTLDTDQDYEAEVDFDTVPEPVPVTGVIFNALPYVGLMAIGIGVIFIGIALSRKARSVITKLARIHNLDIHRTVKYSLPCFAVIGVLIGGVIAKNVSAEHYTEIIKSIELTSQHTSYANNEPGAWNVTKSAEWIGQDKARITFNVDTVTKAADNKHLDLIIVIDNSGSMSGSKIEQVKQDATGLIESVLSDTDNRIALVSFGSGASKLSDLTADETALIDLIDNMQPNGSTNYYGGFKMAEEVLEGYQKQSDRELIMLFLTDGYPNEKTPNEVAEYRMLKKMYPYMTINGIQYEMGDEVLDPIKQVSDNQFIAAMSSLNNVLFEASIAPYVFDSFILTDYINDEYWDVDSVNSIEATIGEVTLTYEGNVPVVTWTMNEALVSGYSPQLSIDITLKNAGSIAENTFLPTNNHETVQSSLPETPSENISSDSTPVLKSSYNVIYEPNLPSSCSVYGGTVPAEQTYLPMTIVEKTSNALSCDGHNFNGWEIASGSPKVINDDYFKITNDDVILRATWTKPSIAKSMDGEVKEEVAAKLDTGPNINVAFKKLSGQSSATTSTDNTIIKAVKTATSMSGPQQDSATVISIATSPVSVYAWFDDVDDTIYIYSEADRIDGNANMGYLFNVFRSLEDISALADWNVSDTTDMKWMFRNATSLTSLSALSNWNTQNVTTMSSMFERNTSLVDISGLSNWDTSKVKNMYYMFYGISSLTDISALSDWDTSSVTNMGTMFHGASGLTDLEALADWDTSKVTTMAGMFRSATHLTDIDALADWDTSKVTDMSFMFHSASNLTDISGAANWDTSKVTDMHCMFEGARNLTSAGTGADWDTSSVTNMGNMFYGASSLTNISALSGWDTSSVKNMSGLFYGTSSLTDISALANWNTSSVTNMQGIFSGASSLASAGALSNWNTSSVTNMSNLFYGASSLTDISALSGWDTSSVTDMSGSFYNNSSLTNISALSGWDTSNVTSLSSMFADVSSLTNISALSSWDTSRVTNMSALFSGVSSLTNISALSGWNTSNVTNMSLMFQSTSSLTDIATLSSWSTASVTDMRAMFNMSALTSISALSGWNTSSVTDMSYMFRGVSGITDISPLANWDISSVTNMNSMFRGVSGITDTSPLSNWNTSSIADMGYLFSGASGLTNVGGVSSWNTSSVTNMSYMFYSTSNLSDISALSGWDTSSVTNMSYMFYNVSSLTNISPLSSWTTSSVTNMSHMFDRVSNLSDISALSGWNTSNVTDMSYMFRSDGNITSLSPIFGWTVSSSTNKSNMFYGIPDSVQRPGWY